MVAGSCEAAVCRTLYTTLIRIPAELRLEAAGVAVEILAREIGEDNQLYKGAKSIQAVCLVHDRVRQLVEDSRREQTAAGVDLEP